MEFDRITERYKHAQDHAERHELFKQAREILDESNRLVSVALYRVDCLNQRLASLAAEKPLYRWKC